MFVKNLFYIFLIGIAFISVYGNVTYQYDQNAVLIESTDGKNCTRAGFMCDDCSISSNCYQLPNGTWVKELVENCTASQMTCLESTGICTADPNDDCPIQPVEGFVCNQPGVFPDPFDCSKYHICTPGDGKFNDHPVQCASGFFYDSLTTLCSRKTSLNCTLAVPRCINVTIGPVFGNPTMYYQCVSVGKVADKRVYAPRLYQCPPDHKYMKSGCHDVKKPEKVASNVCRGENFLYRPGCTNSYYCSNKENLAVKSNCPRGYYYTYTYNGGPCLEFNCNSLML